MSTQPISQTQRDGEAILASAERIRRREEAARPQPWLHRAADMTPDQLFSALSAEWQQGGGDFLIDVPLWHVEAALEALDGNDPKAQRGAAVVLTLAYRERFSVAADESLRPWIAKVLAHAREALGLHDDTEALLSKVGAALKGKAAVEDLLVAIAAAGDPARFVNAYRIGAQEVSDAATYAWSAVTSYRNYLPRLEEIEAKAGTLDVPRLSPSALKALEQVSSLTAVDWSKDRRPAAVEALRSLVSAFGRTYWCRPAEFPQVEVASIPEKPRRSGVLGKILG